MIEEVVRAVGWGLLAVLAVTGAATAFAVRPPLVASAHHAAAAGLLLVTVAFVSASYAQAVYRERPAVWLVRVGLLAIVGGLYATGSGLVPGEHGAEGRAHMGAATGLAAPSWGLVLATHALVLAPALAAGVAWSTREARGLAARGRRTGVVAGALALALSAGALVPAAAVVPEVDGAEAARAPWAVRALEPLEGAWGVPLATLAGGVALATLAFAPLLDRGTRPPWLRPVVTLVVLVVLAGYVTLSLYAGYTTPTDHLHATAESSA